MHVPVLVTEITEFLQPAPGKTFLDGTFGRGGHTRMLLQAGATVWAFDQDSEAIAYGHSAFSAEVDMHRLVLFHANFSQLSTCLQQRGAQEHQFDGALFDLGMSSNQVDESGRGFTFSKDEPLDMRMSDELGVTAADLVNALPEKHLKSLLWENAQETAASPIARAIVQDRAKRPFRTTKELADLVWSVKRGRDGKLHPATKTFMALRMAVNSELDNLTLMLDQVLPWLAPGGRLAMMSFHEGEDRIVKQRYTLWEKLGRGRRLGPQPVIPSEEEVQKNPRSRSAKLRGLEVV